VAWKPARYAKRGSGCLGCLFRRKAPGAAS
jgi:hypothetical protein